MLLDYLTGQVKQTLNVSKDPGLFDIAATRVQIRYLPSYLEKILVLGKENGQFPSIAYEEIPFIICRASKEKFPPLEKTVQADVDSRKLEEGIWEKIPPMPPEPFICDYICKLRLPLK